jgi:Immunity protein 35
MLTKKEAVEIVLKKLEQMSSSADPFVVIEKSTLEKSFGWIFFYNSKKFVETGESRYRLAGNGPVIVNKQNGLVEFFGTSKRLQEIVEDYEQRLDA